MTPPLLEGIGMENFGGDLMKIDGDNMFGQLASFGGAFGKMQGKIGRLGILSEKTSAEA